MLDPTAAPDAPEPPYRRTAPSLIEPLVVLGLVLLVFGALALREQRPADGAPLPLTDRRVAITLLVEALLAAALLPWLRRRGWTPAAVAGAPSPRDLASGAVVWLGTMACVSIAFYVVAAVNRDVALVLMDIEFTGTLSTSVVMAAAVGNALFEEFLWIGYAVPTLEPRLGLRGACAVSVLLRASLQLFDGPLALVSILPAALFLTWYFARTRRLWPVVAAHVLLDAIGLAQFVK